MQDKNCTAHEAPLDQEVAEALKSYENPRGLPNKWIVGYLKRPRIQLALDVMRAYDKNAQNETQIGRDRIIIAVLSTVITTLAWKGVEALSSFFLR